LHCRKGFGRALGITANQFAVLAGVANRQGNTGISIKEIAEHVSLASTRVTTEVSRLENMGFLRKRINGGDRRGVLVSLSKHGEMAFNRVIPLIRRTNALLFENILKRELENARIVAEMLIAKAEYALDQLDLAQTQMHRP